MVLKAEYSDFGGIRKALLHFCRWVDGLLKDARGIGVIIITGEPLQRRS